jgi:protein O-GlcNAc transferase
VTVEEGLSLIAARDLKGALGCFREAVSADRDNPEGWHLLGRVLLELGQPAEALQPAERAVSLAPASANHQYVLGRVYKALGNLELAVTHYETAVRLAPGDAALHVSLGIVLRALGRMPEAAAAYRRALAIDPQNSQARFNLARLLGQSPETLHSGGQSVTALSEAQRAEVLSLVTRGDELLAQGLPAEALPLFTRAAEIVPQVSAVQRSLGTTLLDMGSLESALVHLDLAARLEPHSMFALERAACVAATLGLQEAVAGYLNAALRLRPNEDAFLLRRSLTLRAVEESTASIAATRARWNEQLDGFLARPLRFADPFLAQLTLFYLAYHGHCNRELQTKVGQVMLRGSPELGWVAPHVGESRRTDERIKIGFVSRFMHTHSIGKTTKGLVKELSRERFEIHVLNIPPLSDDETTRWIRQHADHYLNLEPTLEAARRQIAALRLDVLFYQDIGMEPNGYFLAYSRLAPVQCVSFGHPDTTGIPNMDYFVSNDLFEPEGAAEHYSEQLFLLHDLPTLAYYYRPEPVTAPPPRTLFGLSDDEHIYLCPQTLFKVHPEFDFLLAEILRRDPLGRVVLIRNHCQIWSNQLTERLRRSVPDVADRISYIAPLNAAGFTKLLAAVDVVLDTVHFNGMNTSLEAFSVGAAVVTLPKSLQRGRHTQAMYRKMELTECIARDERDYADIAVRLGTDASYRGQVRRQILDRNGVLFENRRVVEEFERFFVAAVDRACP